MKGTHILSGPSYQPKTCNRQPMTPDHHPHKSRPDEPVIRSRGVIVVNRDRQTNGL